MQPASWIAFKAASNALAKSFRIRN
jgi:hypothetical protein